MNDTKRLELLVGVFACLGALISATYVVYSYLTTNRAFVQSLRPYLLLQVRNVFSEGNIKSDSTRAHLTQIFYCNNSQNAFHDLTIHVRISVATRETTLDDLFKPEMYLAVGDGRQRAFPTHELLQKKGIDLDAEVGTGRQVELLLDFTYTFLGNLETKRVQPYRWNQVLPGWEIE